MIKGKGTPTPPYQMECHISNSFIEDTCTMLQKRHQEKYKQLTRENVFGIGHIGPRSNLPGLAILITLLSLALR